LVKLVVASSAMVGPGNEQAVIFCTHYAAVRKTTGLK
jgi:hypothetical protein